MEARAPGSADEVSAVRRLAAALRSLWHTVCHHLPAVLLLSVAAAALLTARPDFLRSLDAGLMALTDRGGRSLVQHLPGASGADDLLKTLQEERLGWGKAVTVLTLAPAAHKEWLHGASPLPRAEMACFLRQLAAWVAKGRSARQAVDGAAVDWRPVIALDFDVTPVESAGIPAAWDNNSPVGNCVLQPADGRPAPQACNKINSSEDAMRCALSRLTDEALVLAIVYPRTTQDGLSRRNAFIKSTCACTSQDCPADPDQTSSQDGRLIYASPHLGVSAGEQVFEFPHQLKPAETGLPIVFPGLGTVLAELVKASKPVPGQPPAEPADLTQGKPLLNQFCKAVHLSAGAPLLDDQLAVNNGSSQILSRYDYLSIAMGQVRFKIAEAELFPVGPRPSGLSTQPFWLRDTIQTALNGVESSNDVYVVAVDNGTTADRFAVPAFEHSVMGAWVHSAIALSLITPSELAPGPPSAGESAAPARDFGKNFGHELQVGLWVVALAWLLQRLLQAAWRRMPGHYPFLRHLSFSAVPFVAVVLMVAWELLGVHAKYIDGMWSNPLPLLMAMLVHLHLDSMSQARELALEEQRKRYGLSVLQDATALVSRGDQVARWAMQWAWASVLFVALLYWAAGVLGVAAGWAVLSAVGTVCGAAFVQLARRPSLSALPLAWRGSHGLH